MFSNPLCGYQEVKDSVVVCVPPAVHFFHKQYVFVGGNTAMENLVSKEYFASTHRSPNHSHNVCTAALLTRYSRHICMQNLSSLLMLIFGCSKYLTSQVVRSVGETCNFWMLIQAGRWCGLVEYLWFQLRKADNTSDLYDFPIWII